MIPFKIESWIWYSVVVTVLLARIISRTLHLGSFKRLRADDYMMMFVFCTYTTEIVCLNIVSHSETNLLPPGYLETHTIGPQEWAARVFGAKVIVAVERLQCATIWLIKGCILIMYFHLTKSSFPRQHLLVKVLAGYVVGGYVLMELLWYTAWCHPFSQYVAVPTTNPNQCAAAINHLITNAVLNLSSDIVLLGIALPMFVRSNFPRKRKLALCGIFSLGIFVILCAILNKYYSFSHPFGDEWIYWYTREVSTAALVANLPFTWNLVRKLFGDTSPAYVDRPRSRSIRASISSSNSLGWFKERFGVTRGISYESEKSDGVPRLDLERANSIAKPSFRDAFDEAMARESWEREAAEEPVSPGDSEDLSPPPKAHLALDKLYNIPD